MFLASASVIPAAVRVLLREICTNETIMNKLNLLTIFLIATALFGCGTSEKYVPLPNLVYRIDIQQGNLITQEMINQLKPGMSRDQVRYVLGTPPIADAFHQDRWDYVYIYQGGRQDEDEAERRRISLYFEHDKLARLEGDFRPNEQTDELPRKTSTVKVEGERKKRGLLLNVWDKITNDDEDAAYDPGSNR
jgi:outer membrane protein assembly factor BamE